MYEILYLCLGVVLGCLFTFAAARYFLKIGNLLVDRSDKIDGPYLFLELSKGVNQSVNHKKYVVLRVVDRNLDSRN